MIDYLYYGFLLVSLILIYFAAKSYYSTKDLVNSGYRTKAEVIKLIEIRGDDSSTYKPVFEYTDRSGNNITFKSNISSRPAPHNVGDFVSIIHSENNEDVKLVSFWGLYRVSIILLSIASPLLIIGGGYYFYIKGLL